MPSQNVSITHIMAMQWGAGNVYLLVLYSSKVNIAENLIAVMGLQIRSGSVSSKIPNFWTIFFFQFWFMLTSEPKNRQAIEQNRIEYYKLIQNLVIYEFQGMYQQYIKLPPKLQCKILCQSARTGIRAATKTAWLTHGRLGKNSLLRIAISIKRLRKRL